MMHPMTDPDGPLNAWGSREIAAHTRHMQRLDAARSAEAFEAMNAPQIRRDRWQDRLAVCAMALWLALTAIGLTVWAVVAMTLVEVMG